jgi:hypothetical protein
MKRYAIRIALVGAVLGVLITSSSLVATAGAINPPQATVQGVVNSEYWDLEAFWKPILNYYGLQYTRPGVRYFDYYDSAGRVVDFPSTTAGRPPPPTSMAPRGSTAPART